MSHIRNMPLELLDRYALKEIQIVVPDLFWAEIGNVLWKAARTHRITIEDARIGLLKVTDCNFPTVPSFSLLTRAFVSRLHGRSFCDCLYVALAESSRQLLQLTKIANRLQKFRHVDR